MSEMRNLEWKTDVDPSVWTQCSKDENVSRAISRMTQSFEDVRVYLIQQLRAQEEATDAEIIKREEVERAREEDKVCLFIGLVSQGQNLFLFTHCAT